MTSSPSRTDIVYPVREGDNEELRYSLRTLRNLPHRNVWIIGGPDWPKVHRIDPPLRVDDKEAVIVAKLRAAIANPGISDPFILMNDDMMIMQPIDQVPVLHTGRLANWLPTYQGDGFYREATVATMRLLAELGHPDPLGYDLHVPVTVHKAAMTEALDLGAHIVGLRYVTLYGNLQHLGGTYSPDVKVRRLDDSGPPGPFLSTDDLSWPGLVGNRVRAAFPDPSPYEVT